MGEGLLQFARDRRVHVGDEAYEALDVERRPVWGALEVRRQAVLPGQSRSLAQGARSEEGIILELGSIAHLRETH